MELQPCKPSDEGCHPVVRNQCAALKEVKRSGPLPVPMHLRNAPTDLLKELGCGEGYLDPHKHPNGYVEQQYLPDNLSGRRFYEPVDWANEKTISDRLKWWRDQE